MAKWLIGICLAGAPVFLANERSLSLQPPPHVPAAAPAAAFDQAAEPDRKFATVEPAASHPADRELTPADQTERERWLVQHGYFSTDYTSYSEAVLRQMIALGDRIAMEELADRLKVVEPLEAIELDRRAALLGSTSAMHRTLNIHRNLARGQPASDEDFTRVELIDAFAWGLVLQMRGDPNGASSNLDIQLHDALHAHEVKVACTLAGDFYADLSDERLDAGLRAFDNAPPPVVSVDLGRAGDLCARWPAQRASCERDAQLPAAVTLHAFRCHLSETTSIAKRRSLR